MRKFVYVSEMLIVRHLGTPNSGFNGCHCMRDPVLYRSMDEAQCIMAQNRDYNRSPTSVGTFDVNGAAHVASRILAAILLASKNGEFDRVLLGSSLQKLDYQ